MVVDGERGRVHLLEHCRAQVEFLESGWLILGPRTVLRTEARFLRRVGFRAGARFLRRGPVFGPGRFTGHGPVLAPGPGFWAGSVHGPGPGFWAGHLSAGQARFLGRGPVHGPGHFRRPGPVCRPPPGPRAATPAARRRERLRPPQGPWGRPVPGTLGPHCLPAWHMTIRG